MAQSVVSIVRHRTSSLVENALDANAKNTPVEDVRSVVDDVFMEACNLHRLGLALALGLGHLYFPAHDPVRCAEGAARPLHDRLR